MGSGFSCLKKGGNNDVAPASKGAASKDNVSGARRRRSSVEDETGRRESVFFDAVQTATASMLYVPSSLPNYRPRGSVAMDDPESLLRSVQTNKKLRQTMIVKQHLDEPTVKLELRGYPGDLTQEEMETCLAFRKALKDKDDPSYQEMVKAFEDVEDEPYALCRFLRGRNFDLDATLEMMDESVPTWKDGKPHDFYPSIEGAVGCPAPVFLMQYPYFYSGVGKNGCPVGYLRAGDLSVEGVECVTDLDKVQYYMWNAFMYQFKREVARAQAADPTAVRCESITVIDLKGLDSSQLNKKTLATLQSITTIGCCFPELLNQMVILNTPWSFNIFWKLIKRFLEARTVAKIEIFTNEQQGNQRLSELIDKSEILSTYGGEGPSFEELAHGAENKSGSARQIAELLTPSGKAVSVAELTSSEKATVRVYSRSTSGAKITLLKDGNVLKEVELKSSDADSSGSYCADVVSDESGPCELQVKAKSSNSADYFLIHIEVFPVTSN